MSQSQSNKQPPKATFDNGLDTSIFIDAKRYNVVSMMQMYITMSLLHKFLLGEKSLVPGWLAVDVNPTDPRFWVDTLTNVSIRPDEDISASSASFYDTLPGRCEALCAKHALSRLGEEQDPNGEGPRAAAKNEPTFEGWMGICDGGEGASFVDIHAKWNTFFPLFATDYSWEDLEQNWDIQGLVLSLGYVANLTKILTSKCSSLVMEIEEKRTHSGNEVSPGHHVGTAHEVYRLSSPAAENSTEIKNCINDVIHGSFTTQRAEQLLEYIVDFMCWRPPQDSEASPSRVWRDFQLRLEERERKVAERERLVMLCEKWCREREGDLERDESTHRTKIRQILAEIKLQQDMCEKRERALNAEEMRRERGNRVR
ncbi:hypothetical protein VE03_07912 [Pseudogymnoascus sp. 23342-1-I1]|nr:hypothetical protein VE03_07912 [Pseudogymnoascus sp. 23342-1-I1]